MTVSEFIQLVMEAKLVNDICMQRDLGLMFTQAMMPVANEVTS